MSASTSPSHQKVPAKLTPTGKKASTISPSRHTGPIMLIGIDYPSKTITCTKTIMPSGDIDKDMREIKLYFKNFKGKHLNNFTIGDIDKP
ncbi:acyltransferase family protein [gut metagenome]|uniref:Acyltransferase family protein n=1 Tax=gut metagenome TaxID=749906 RepID=J9CKG9_9ZZZZ